MNNVKGNAINGKVQQMSTIEKAGCVFLVILSIIDLYNIMPIIFLILLRGRTDLGFLLMQRLWVGSWVGFIVFYISSLFICISAFVGLKRQRTWGRKAAIIYWGIILLWDMILLINKGFNKGKISFIHDWWSILMLVLCLLFLALFVIEGKLRIKKQVGRQPGK